MNTKTTGNHKLRLLNTHINYLDVSFLVLIILSLCLKIWKAKFGISEYDEAFYLSIPHRMSLGDSLFLNEWHPSQMSSFLLYPIFRLYMFVFGTTEGIQLAFRYIYIAFHLIVVLYVYYKIRKNGFFTVLGCILYFLFSPFQLMALSYNTFGLDFVLLTSVILSTYQYNKKVDVLRLVFAGIFFAASVICCPYLIFAYLLYIITSLVKYIRKRIKKQCHSVLVSDAFSIRSVIFFSIGCLMLAAIFFLYLFTHMNMATFLDNIKYILSDPEHMPISIIDKSIIFVKSFFISNNILFVITSLVYVLSFLVMIFDKKRRQHKYFYLLIACVYTIVFLFFSREIQFNAFIIPISFLGLFAFVLSKEKKWNVFLFIYLLGLIYSFSLNCSSNTGVYAIGLAFALPSFCSFIFLDDIIYEIKNDIKDTKRILDIITVMCICVTVFSFSGAEIIDTINSCLWDAKVVYPHQLTAKIDNGPMKGIVTTAQRKSMYDNIESDLETIKTYKHKPILCLTNQAWLYLALEDFDYATFSAWLPETDSTLMRLDEYYSTQPNKQPCYIYIPDTGRWKNIEDPLKYYEARGYVSKKCSSGYFLELP